MYKFSVQGQLDKKILIFIGWCIMIQILFNLTFSTFAKETTFCCYMSCKIHVECLLINANNLNVFRVTEIQGRMTERRAAKTYKYTNKCH